MAITSFTVMIGTPTRKLSHFESGEIVHYTLNQGKLWVCFAIVQL
jgi:hypothetical protein